MRARIRNALRSKVIAFTAIPVAAAGIAIAPAAIAAPASPIPGTCTFYHGHIGASFEAIDSYSHRNLAFTVPGKPKPGDVVTLAKYKDNLSQCMHILNGFGKERFEIAIKQDLCITENPNRSAGRRLVLELCLSHPNQMFTVFGGSGARFELARDNKLCVGTKESIRATAVLYQEKCGSSTDKQHWFVNSNP